MRKFAITGVVVLTLLGTGGAVASAAAASAAPFAAPAATQAYGSTPVGTWDAEVTAPDGMHPSTFSFTGGWKACIDYDVPGQGSGHGVGTWTRTGPERFSLSIRHSVYDPNGTLVGYVQVDQNVVQSGVTLSGSGTSQVFDANGQPTGSGNSSFTAARTGATEPPCGP